VALRALKGGGTQECGSGELVVSAVCTGTEGKSATVFRNGVGNWTATCGSGAGVETIVLCLRQQ
jgi:hypothetical protein